MARVAICDVVGHGERVSKVSSWLYDSVQAKMNDPDGASVLTNLNSVALDHGMKAMTTAAVISYYSGTRELTFSYAGHPPAWIWTKEVGVWQRAEVECDDEGPANIPLGVIGNAHYHLSHRSLNRGDRLVVFTDGILETPSKDGELFGEARVGEVLNHTTPETSIADVRRAVVSAAKEYGNGSLAHDDVTLVALEVN